MTTANRPIDYKSKLDAAANTLASVTYAAGAGEREVDIAAAGPGQLPLPPVVGTAGNQVVVELAAGGAGITGKLNVGGFTEK